MKKSLRLRLIVLYILLVFIAMTIVSLFITREFKAYNNTLIRDDLTNISNNLVSNISILHHPDFEQYQDQIQQSLMNMPINSAYEISIIDPNDFKIIASTNKQNQGKNALTTLEEGICLEAISKGSVEKNIKNFSTDGTYYIKNIATAHKNADGKISYIIYQRANMDDVNKMLNSVNNMIFQATLIALIFTVVLGYFISDTITKPINAMTKKTLILSKGDFSQRVEVYSDDEIGQLSSTFNYLGQRLQEMIREMAYEKNKLNAIIYHMQNGLVAIDNNGLIIHHNPNFIEMLGLEPNTNLMGKTYDDVIMDFSEDINFSKLINSFSSKKDSSVIVEKNDKYFRALPGLFNNDEGSMAGILVVFQDITQIQKLDIMRREFVANVSHELKTPITSIMSYSETLIDGAIDDKEIAIKFLEVIEQESKRIANIVNDLLQLSNMDFKKEIEKKISVDPDKLATDCIMKMQVLSSNKSQLIVNNITDNHVNILCDPGKIQQVIINLISNAVKYTPEGGTIELSTSLVDNMWKLDVKDNGIGIPKQDLDRVFERFFRVDKGRSRAQGGTGLGLSIVKAIVQKHNGEISVDSVYGEGSTFTVTIPVDSFVDKN